MQFATASCCIYKPLFVIQIIKTLLIIANRDGTEEKKYKLKL